MCDKDIKTVYHVYQWYALVFLPSPHCLDTFSDDDEVVVLALVMDVRDSAIGTSHCEYDSRSNWGNTFEISSFGSV